MDIWEAMEQRHSVRSYSEKEISFELTEALQAEIDACNRESGLDIRLIRDEERAFGRFPGALRKISRREKLSCPDGKRRGRYGRKGRIFRGAARA